MLRSPNRSSPAEEISYNHSQSDSRFQFKAGVLNNILCKEPSGFTTFDWYQTNCTSLLYVERKSTADVPSWDWHYTTSVTYEPGIEGSPHLFNSIWTEFIVIPSCQIRAQSSLIICLFYVLHFLLPHLHWCSLLNFFCFTKYLPSVHHRFNSSTKIIQACRKIWPNR